MGATATYLLPYPELDEPDDVPADVRELAERIEVILPTFQEVADYGTPNGYAPLDANGKVPAAYLPPAASQVTVSQKKTTKDVVNTNLAVDLFNGELAIAAGAMTLTGRTYLTAYGDYLNNTGGNKQLTLALLVGGQTLWQSNAFTLSANANRRAWRITAEFSALDATHVMASGYFVAGDPSALPFSGQGGISTTEVGGPLVQSSANLPSGVPNAAPVPIALTAQHSATSAQQSCRLVFARIETMP